MAETADAFVIGSFVVAVSTHVGRFPLPGESLAASRLVVEPGGKGFNLALGLHRLGVAVEGVMAVGDDIFGAFAAAAVERAGLPQSMLSHVSGQTGAGIGFSTGGGDNCLAIFPGANASLSAADVLAHEALASAKIVLAQFETCDAAVHAGFADARSRGAETVLNPSPYRSIDPDILANTSILIVNETEAAQLARDLGLSPDSGPALADHLFGRGVHTLVITLGKDGVNAYRIGEAPLCRPALQVHAFDALGAGDAFTAGFVSGRLRGHDFAQCLDTGIACGAFCVGRPGVYDALPFAQDIYP